MLAIKYWNSTRFCAHQDPYCIADAWCSWSISLLSHAHVHLSRRLESSWNWSELESTCIDLLLLKGVH